MADLMVSALVNCGGYALLCGLTLWQLEKERDAHRQETNALADALRENTAAISGLASTMVERAA